MFLIFMLSKLICESSLPFNFPLKKKVNYYQKVALKQILFDVTIMCKSRKFMILGMFLLFPLMILPKLGQQC